MAAGGGSLMKLATVGRSAARCTEPGGAPADCDVTAGCEVTADSAVTAGRDAVRRCVSSGAGSCDASAAGVGASTAAAAAGCSDSESSHCSSRRRWP